MRVTIIADDNAVYVEGRALTVDLTGLDPDIHAIQWYGNIGEIEYKYHPVEHTKLNNKRFNDLSPYQSFVDRWTVEAKKADQAAKKPASATQKSSSGAMHVVT